MRDGAARGANSGKRSRDGGTPLELSAKKFFESAEAEGARIAPKRMAFIDIEATGDNPDEDDIIEIGAVAVRRKGNAIGIDKFQTLVKTTRPMHWAAKKKTKLSLKILHQHGHWPAKALTEFMKWARRAKPEFCVAHGSHFDEWIIAANMWRHCMDFPRLPKFKCTHRMAKAHLPYLGSHGLEAVAAHYGIKNPQPRRALADAETAAACFFEMAAEEPRLLDINHLAKIEAWHAQEEALLRGHTKAKTKILAEEADPSRLGMEGPGGLLLAAFGKAFSLRNGQTLREAHFMDSEAFEHYKWAKRRLELCRAE